MKEKTSDFHLEKWFLDLVTETGETMIFYAAKLRWKNWILPYTSWLHHSQENNDKTRQRSRFSKVNMPVLDGQNIRWEDQKFDVSGVWESNAAPIHARLFDSGEGYLDWNCLQPYSQVSVEIGGQEIKGTGYAEQLILTAMPWKIPMDQLRWGRFVGSEDHIVWIEIREKEKRQWLWWNGEKIENISMQDDKIQLTDGSWLELDRKYVLEGEKKIFSVVQDLVKFIPGFDKAMPLKFLMADEHKWLSNGTLHIEGDKQVSGHSIHELVDFKSNPS